MQLVEDRLPQILQYRTIPSFHLDKHRRLVETPISKFGASSTFTEVYSALMSVLYKFFFVFTACKICNIDHKSLLAKEEQQITNAFHPKTNKINQL